MTRSAISMFLLTVAISIRIINVVIRIRIRIKLNIPTLIRFSLYIVIVRLRRSVLIRLPLRNILINLGGDKIVCENAVNCHRYISNIYKI